MADPVRVYYTKLAETFHKLVKFYQGRGASCLHGDGHMTGLVLQGFASVMEYSCKTSDDKVEKIKPMCSLCLTVLNTQQVWSQLVNIMEGGQVLSQSIDIMGGGESM